MMGIIAYWWMVDFPENAHRSFRFLNKNETDLAVARIQKDRGDVELTPFSCTEVLRNFLDPKIYAFAVMFFLLVCSTAWLLDTSFHQSDHARTLSRQLYHISCRSCIVPRRGCRRSLLIMRPASKAVWALPQTKPYYSPLL